MRNSRKQKKMRLTDNKIRDITRLLEEGKPLPEKYRFLLFEEKREIELLWNGKTDETFTKQPNILEELAYRDTWGKGSDSFIAMIYERLSLMKDLLENDGSIYVHCDWRVNSEMRKVLNELFGSDSIQSEIVWKRRHAHSNAKTIGYIHDTIFFYTKGESFTWNPQYMPYEDSYIERYYRYVEEKTGRIFLSRSVTGHRGVNKVYEWRGLTKPWRYPPQKLGELDKQNRFFWTRNGEPCYKQYLDEMPGMPTQSIWTDIKFIDSWSDEATEYSTQKPESLLERIIGASSNEGDLIADFFCGSGTIFSASEKLNRKWIGSDLGKLAIHTTRKRLINIQRNLKSENKSYRAFEILNLGKYERQFYIGVNPDLREMQKQKQQEEKGEAFLELILHAYRAEPTEKFNFFQGKKD